MINSLGESFRANNEGEPFVQTSSLERMILAGISDRVDEQGIVLPEELKLCPLQPTPANADKRPKSFPKDGWLIPEDKNLTHNQAKYRSHKFTVESLLYRVLTNSGHAVELSSEQLSTSEVATNNVLAQLSSHGYKTEVSVEQQKPAIHAEKVKGSDQEFEPVRIYMNSGLAAPEVVSQLLDQDADFEYTKVWVPHKTDKLQRLRGDTPILGLVNFRQIERTVGALKKLFDNDNSIINDDFEPLAGMSLPGIPGVYVGQCQIDTSFNNNMKKLFSAPIEKAILSNNLRTGELVTNEWVTQTAQIAGRLALVNASQVGADPTNHAFLAGQPVKEIIAAIKSAASIS